jgi:hypothetical protein
MFIINYFILGTFIVIDPIRHFVHFVGSTFSPSSVCSLASPDPVTPSTLTSVSGEEVTAAVWVLSDPPNHVESLFQAEPMVSVNHPFLRLVFFVWLHSYDTTRMTNMKAIVKNLFEKFIYI